jgi:5-methyltetrahydrofolate--homocysteine methyltransferase
MKPYLTTLSTLAPCLTAAYPNAGLPDAKGLYSDTPESMSRCVEDFMKDGLVNIVGGCCGSTPVHIAAIAACAQGKSPRKPVYQLFEEALAEGDYEDVADNAREMADAGLLYLHVNPDKAADPAGTLTNYLFYANSFTELAILPLVIESANWNAVLAGLKCLQTRASLRWTGAPLSVEQKKLIHECGAEILL